LIEIDSDGHRSGVKPDDAVLLDIGRILEGGGTQLRGIMTHAGDSYNCDTVEKIRAMAVRERDAVARCAARLRAAGLPCPIVSVGSTPTATYSEDLTGVTEVRAGVYMFFDLVMAGLNVCKVDDIAVSVLATVIGHQPDKGWIITDAGWMAMSRDRGTAAQKTTRVMASCAISPAHRSTIYWWCRPTRSTASSAAEAGARSTRRAIRSARCCAFCPIMPVLLRPSTTVTMSSPAMLR
jgi:D-serine deaminase-like pyridoxal phosphate-dependent protein